MKKTKMKKYLAIGVIALLIFSFSGVSFASDLNKTGEFSEELDAYLEELVSTLDSSGAELSEINRLIKETDQAIEENSLLLEQTQKDSKSQEASMKKRIKYLYESSGDMNIIEALLTADSIGDAISRTAYISNIVDYDRDMLSRYIETIDSINALQTDLKESRTKLVSLRDNFSQVGEELSAVVSEVPEKMAALGVEEDEIEQVIEEYRQEHPTEAPEEVPQVVEAPEEEQPAEEEAAPEETEAVPEETEAVQPEETEAVQPEETEAVQPEETEAPEPEPEPEPTTLAPEPEPEPEPTTQAPEPEPEPGSPNDDPVWNLARITYLENGVMYPESSYQSIYLTACVVINRANAWFGGSIMDSIYAPGAYATAYKYDAWGGGELVINDITWQAVNEALANCDPNPFYQCNGSWLEGMGLREYYRDPVTNEVFYYLD